MDNEKFQDLVLTQFGRMDLRFEELDLRLEKLDQRFERLDQQFEKMDLQLDGIESQIKENTQILKELEHVAEVNKSEHDKINFTLAKIENELVKLKDITAKNCYDLTYLKA